MNMQSFRRFLLLGLLLAVTAGCRTTFHNFTPERIPQNPSGIYTFSFAFEQPGTNIIEGSERASIVINGETFPMSKVDAEGLAFSFDYKIPPGITEARYYFVLTYDFNNSGMVRTVTRYSTHTENKVFTSRLINRYPIQLIAERGPVGARIALVGSGFTPQDVVVVGTSEADTTVISPNSIEFTVPALPAGQAYEVAVRTASGDLPVNRFRIDAANLSVQPTALEIPSGETEFLIFELANPAPIGGLILDVLTDIPSSIIMPEVFVPEGARSVNVNVTGAEPGSGILKVSGPGFAPVTVPVTVF